MPIGDMSQNLPLMIGLNMFGQGATDRPVGLGAAFGMAFQNAIKQGQQGKLLEEEIKRTEMQRKAYDLQQTKQDLELRKFEDEIKTDKRTRDIAIKSAEKVQAIADRFPGNPYFQLSADALSQGDKQGWALYSKGQEFEVEQRKFSQQQANEQTRIGLDQTRVGYEGQRLQNDQAKLQQEQSAITSLVPQIDQAIAASPNNPQLQLARALAIQGNPKAIEIFNSTVNPTALEENMGTIKKYNPELTDQQALDKATRQNQVTVNTAPTLEKGMTLRNPANPMEGAVSIPDSQRYSPAERDKVFNEIVKPTATTFELTKRFKPEFSGISTDTKSWLGSKVSISPEQWREIASWWKDWRAMAAPIRHLLYGANLPAKELEEYYASTISESDDPRVISAYLKRTNDLLQRAFEANKQADVEAGYPAKVWDNFKNTMGGWSKIKSREEKQAAAAAELGLKAKPK